MVLMSTNNFGSGSILMLLFHKFRIEVKIRRPPPLRIYA